MVWIVDEVAKLLHYHLRCFNPLPSPLLQSVTKTHPADKAVRYYVGNHAEVSNRGEPVNAFFSVVEELSS